MLTRPHLSEAVMTNLYVLAVLLSVPAAPPTPSPAKGEKAEKVDKAPKEEVGDLTVNVTEVVGKKGKLVIALYRQAGGFPNDIRKAWKVESVDAAKPTCTFADLPSGKYAVIVYHDVNSNGKLDQIMPFGIPAEPIAVSNYPKLTPQTGFPRFGKARFPVDGATTIDVNLVEFGK